METPAQRSSAAVLPMLVKKQGFYNELSSLVRRIPKYNLLIIGGDMNAQIVENVNHKFSLHNSSNRKWRISKRFPARKLMNMPQYKISEKKGNTMDL